MKKNVLFKTFILALFALSAFGTSFIFANNNKTANASSSVILITPLEPITTTQSFFTVEATLINSSFTGTSIEWLINNQLVTQVNKIEVPSGSPEKSLLKMFNSEYKNASNQEVWIFQARLKTNTSVSAFTTVTFKDSSNPLTINALTSQKQTYSTTISPFSFEVLGLQDETSIEWYKLDNTNKYTRISGANQRTYTFAPDEAGKYSFVAKVGNVYSDNFMVSVDYKPLPTQLKFTVTQATDNASGFNTYLFELTDVNNANDVDNINWFIQGQQLPVQYGGSTFVFEPSSYITYRIYAKYTNPETNETKSSDSHTIEVRIDRTLDIIIGSSIAIGIMGIGLIISIIVHVKKEKVW